MGVRGARATLVADARTDAELAIEAAGGSSRAFESLYRRHSEAAWRVAYAVTGNRDDAADAVSDAFTRVLQALPSGRLTDASLVRSYLLTATRNAAIDVSRRGGRVQSTDRIEQLDDGTKVVSPNDRITEREDVSLVTAAFRSLPERWRSVLWLTEVEGIPPAKAAALLGVTPNNAAQLAVRARAGLRERFVQAHVSGAVAPECKFTVERLGAYVTGRLAPRDLAKVDQHLAACEPCTKRRDELEDVGGMLRRVVVPIPLLLGPAVLAKWKLVSSAGAVESAAHATSAAGRWWTDVAARVQKPLMAATTGIFAVGVIVAAPNVLGNPRSGGPGVGGGRVPVSATDQTAARASIVPERTIRLTSSTPFVVPDPVDLAAFAAPEPAAAAEAAPEAAPAGDDTAGPPDGGSPEPAPESPPPPSEEPTAQVGIATVVGPVHAGVVAGDDCRGGYVNTAEAGCEAPVAEAPTAGVTATISGSALPTGTRTITVGF